MGSRRSPRAITLVPPKPSAEEDDTSTGEFYPHLSGHNQSLQYLIHACQEIMTDPFFLPFFMPPEPVPGVDPPGKGVLQPAHPSGKVGLLCLKQQVIVIAHQNVGVNSKPRPFTRFAPALAKKCPGPPRPAQ